MAKKKKNNEKNLLLYLIAGVVVLLVFIAAINSSTDWRSSAKNIRPTRTPNPARPLPSSFVSPTTVKTFGCIRTGCSGQICADQEMMTTCEFREEYACYQGAICERQANGECGFTPTEELTACLLGMQ